MNRAEQNRQVNRTEQTSKQNRTEQNTTEQNRTDIQTDEQPSLLEQFFVQGWHSVRERQGCLPGKTGSRHRPATADDTPIRRRC